MGTYRKQGEVYEVCVNRYSFLLAGCSDYSRVDDYISSIEVKHNASMMKFGALTKKQRILDAYAYYKDRGFFKDSEISDKNIVNKILLTNDFDEHFDPFSTEEGNYYFIYGDLYILSLDSKRVWFEDIERDVVRGNNAYVQVLQEWSSISLGKFNPQNITEKWKSDQGPVTVSFTLDDQKYSLKLTKQSDFMDMDIILKINKIIEDSGYRFESVSMNQVVCVVLLTINEKTIIEKERMIPFN